MPYAFCAALFVYAVVSVGTIALAAGETDPVRLDRSNLAGVGLAAIPQDAYQDILVAGRLNMRVASLFAGKDLEMEIFSSTPAKTDHRKRPTDGDEFVYVLDGKLILTEPSGKIEEFLPGESVMLPAGYTGTWEMQGNYKSTSPHHGRA